MNRMVRATHLFSIFAAVLLATTPSLSDPSDDVKAAYRRGDVEWFRRAVERGNAEAQFIFGLMHEGSRLIPQDYAEAVKLYRKAAEQGYSMAQSRLGFMYKDGEGVPQDHVEAVMWFRKAAEQGSAVAQTQLGLLYFEGKGILQDLLLAYMWLDLAGSQAKGESEKNERRTARDAAAAKMTPAEIAEAQKLAREWKPKTQ